MPNESLEPLDPATARQMYLDDRRREVAEATLQSHSYRLNHFVEWCDEVGIENLNNVTSRDIHRYRVKRRDEDGLATATMKGQLATLRKFCRFCASINAMKPGLDEKIILPKTTAEDARDELLEEETAEQILEYLDQFQYATIKHTLLEVLWHTGLRVGAAVGCDVRDYNPEDQSIELVHRPKTGTQLKNGTSGERFVALSDRVCQVLDDWLQVNRPDVVDDYDRHPLLTSRCGRLSRTRARAITYECTRPCVFGDTCPHDREIETCEATGSSKAYGCPSSLSPHPVRRGSITYHLREDTPKAVVSDRMDVSEEVLDRHYDQRSKREKLQQRRRYLPDE